MNLNMFQQSGFLRSLIRADGHMLEAQNATLCIIVGTVFLLERGNLYNRFPDTYEFMEWCPAWVWGLIYLTSGFVHLLTLRFGYRYFRKHILLVKSGLWMFLAVCVLYGDGYSIGGYFYLVFSMIALRSFLGIQIQTIDENRMLVTNA